MTKKPSTFTEKVYALTKQIPAGKVATYKTVAEGMDTKAYRAIGQALRCNPNAPHTPCHRVVASDGSLGGFKGSKAKKELSQKIALLKKEGVTIVDNRVKNFSKIKHTFQ